MEIAAGLGRVAAFLALLVGSLLAFGFGANWLSFRFRRRNAERCASLAAAGLGLVSRADSDPSVPQWHGHPVGQSVIVAAHAWGILGDVLVGFWTQHRNHSVRCAGARDRASHRRLPPTCSPRPSPSAPARHSCPAVIKKIRATD